MPTPLDAIGFPTRGLSPDALAARLAEWVRWPIERGTARELEKAGRRLRVHALDCGGGARLVTVVELKKRHFLPAEEIVCFFPAFGGGAERTLAVEDVVTASCPLEPFGVVLAPERLRFRVGNPFEAAPAPGAAAAVSLALLAGRIEPAPGSTRPLVLPTQLVAQDMEISPDLFTVAGRVESVTSFSNPATGETCRLVRLATANGALVAVVRARDASEIPPPGGMAAAEGEFVADIRGTP